MAETDNISKIISGKYKLHHPQRIYINVSQSALVSSVKEMVNTLRSNSVIVTEKGDKINGKTVLGKIKDTYISNTIYTLESTVQSVTQQLQQLDRATDEDSYKYNVNSIQQQLINAIHDQGLFNIVSIVRLGDALTVLKQNSGFYLVGGSINQRLQNDLPLIFGELVNMLTSGGDQSKIASIIPYLYYVFVFAYNMCVHEESLKIVNRCTLDPLAITIQEFTQKVVKGVLTSNLSEQIQKKSGVSTSVGRCSDLSNIFDQAFVTIQSGGLSAVRGAVRVDYDEFAKGCKVDPLLRIKGGVNIQCIESYSKLQGQSAACVNKNIQECMVLEKVEAIPINEKVNCMYIMLALVEIILEVSKSIDTAISGLVSTT